MKQKMSDGFRKRDPVICGLKGLCLFALVFSDGILNSK